MQNQYYLRKNLLRYNVFIFSIPVFILLFILFLTLEKISLNLSIIHPELLFTGNDYVIGLAFALFVSIGIICSPLKRGNVIALAWLFRIGIVFIFMLFFEGYYERLDSFLYYFNSIYYPDFLFIPLNGTFNISIMLSYLFDVFSHSYRFAVLFFSLIGITGLLLFWRAISAFIDNNDRFLLLFLLFLPSLTFWSSTISKEAILLLFVGIYMMAVVSLLYLKELVRPVLLICISFIGFGLFRFWLIALFALSLTFSLILGKAIKRKTIKITGALLSLALSFAMIIHYFRIFEVTNSVAWLQSLAQGWADGGSAQIIYFDSIFSLLLQYPWMMFTSLFRPLIFEGQSLFMLLAGIENTILLVLFVVALFLMIRNWKNRSDIMVSSLIHVVCFALMYGLVSYQNLGTAVRFKVFILPFMITFIYLSISRYMGVKSLPS